MVNLIVAIGKKGEIGQNGDLIWRIPEDLRRFKELTMGHPLIMGRKTWESLPKKPLPGRRNIVVTRNKDFKAEGVEIVHSIAEAIDTTKNEDPFVIGGSEIYNAFLPYVTQLYLTAVDDECRDADAFLKLDLSDDWHLIEDTPLTFSSSGVAYRYQTYRK